MKSIHGFAAIHDFRPIHFVTLGSVGRPAGNGRMTADIGPAVWLGSQCNRKHAASAAMPERTVMKAFIYAILGLAVIGGGIALTASRQNKPVVPPTQTVRESSPSPAVANHPPQQRPQRPVASSVPVQSAPLTNPGRRRWLRRSNPGPSRWIPPSNKPSKTCCPRR